MCAQIRVMSGGESAASAGFTVQSEVTCHGVRSERCQLSHVTVHCYRRVRKQLVTGYEERVFSRPAKFFCILPLYLFSDEVETIEHVGHTKSAP